MSIKIMADAAADIPKEYALAHGIEILPFVLNCDGGEVVADVNLTPEAFYEIFHSLQEIPSTSQISPEVLEEIFRRQTEDGSSLIYVSISANGSGIFNTASLMAQQLREEGLDITVVDSGMFSIPIGLPVMRAAEMAEAGAGKEEILAFLTETYQRDSAYIVVDDLKYLKKGGRIKATQMVISEMLDIKPILKINDGLIEAFGKVRGVKKALSKLVDLTEELMDNPQENEVIVLSSEADERVEILKKMLNERVKPKTISHYHIGPVVTVHIGTGVTAVYFKHKVG